MTDNDTDLHSDELNDQIDFREIIDILLAGKKIIIGVTLFSTIFGIIASLLMSNIYESKALLVPVNQSNSISGALGNYSGLAGLAGINIPAVADENNSVKAIKKINSLSFFKNNILTNIYLPDLMALKSWDHKANKLIYDENIYDAENKVWVRSYSYPQQQVPSPQESFKVFVEEHLGLYEDKKSGFITLSIKHKSPFIAKQWVELIVNEINIFYRTKDKSESEKAVKYLNNQIGVSSLAEIKQVLAQLLQEEIKKLTLVEANELYVFDYIDPAAVMEEKIKPNRSLISLFSAILGLLSSIIFLLIRYYIYETRLYKL